jgi:hypothetical protein
LSFDFPGRFAAWALGEAVPISAKALVQQTNLARSSAGPFAMVSDARSFSGRLRASATDARDAILLGGAAFKVGPIGTDVQTQVLISDSRGAKRLPGRLSGLPKK